MSDMYIGVHVVNITSVQKVLESSSDATRDAHLLLFWL